MSQDAVLKVLKKAKAPLPARDICKVVGGAPKLTYSSLARLIKGKYVKIIEIDRHEALKRYKVKGRMRLYYV